ncbi:MAG TPA: hypothetical protein VGY98_05395, partial [Verrucomicrobiae bacterium]|nr:hypothetical protein [Verrucomicrobiae bacterium]
MKAAGQTAQLDCQADTCLARSVIDTLAREPGLEAVTIDSAHEKISVATLGPGPQGGLETLTRRVTEKIHGAMENRPCALLEGSADCHACETPLSATERRNIII